MMFNLLNIVKYLTPKVEDIDCLLVQTLAIKN